MCWKNRLVVVLKLSACGLILVDNRLIKGT